MATIFARLLWFCLGIVWNHVQPSMTRFLGWESWATTCAITTSGGILVGICLKKFGVPGEIAAVVDNIHLEEGRLDHRQSPSMAVTSLASIVSGGSAGPEAPLVQIIGSTASRFADFLNLKASEVRTLTFCGMAAALGAFFGAPLGGALFALEIPHRNGLEYFESIIPAVVSAFVSYFVFSSLGGIHQPLYPLPAIPGDAVTGAVLAATAIGILGAGAAMCFQKIFHSVGRIFHLFGPRLVLAGGLGGLAIGIISAISPMGGSAPVLFWGEHQLGEMLASYQDGMTGPTLLLAIPLVLVALCKMLSISFTLQSGFRGGFIFPLFFVGAALGLALHSCAGTWVALPVAVLGFMAAVNVAVTKTPLSTAVILTTLSGTSMLPVVLASSLASFLVSSRVRVIHTQRSRNTTMRIES